MMRSPIPYSVKRSLFLIREDESREEPEHRNWWTCKYIFKVLCEISQNGFHNSLFSAYVLVMLILALIRIYIQEMDIVYNVWYTLVVTSVVARAVRDRAAERVTCCMKVGFLMDILSYVHYLPIMQIHLKIICYFIRVHRPLGFIYTADRNTMNSNLLVTAIKYIYYSALLRISCAFCWILIMKTQAAMVGIGRPTRVEATPLFTIQHVTKI